MFVLSLLYLVCTIIRPQDYMPELVGVPLLQVVLVLAFLAWLGSRSKTLAAPQFLILPMFLLVLMVSEVANHWMGGALDQLKTFGPVVIAFIVMATAISVRRQRVVQTFAVFTLCAMVLAAHGVDQSRTGIGWTGATLVEDGRIQYVGIFNDPNDLGLLFVAVLPMALYLGLHGKFLRRVFWLAGAALLLYGVYLTNSRGALLAVLVIGGVYVWYRQGAVTAGVLGALGLAGMKLLSSRMNELDADESSAAGRVDAWYEGLHMFLSQPLFGVGAGNFTDHNNLTAHNSLVLVLAETGFAGFVLWLAFVGYCFWMMVAVLRYKPVFEAGSVGTTSDWPAEKELGMTLLLSLCGMFTAAFFLSRSYTVVLYLVMAVVVGYYVGLRSRFPDLPAFNLQAGWWRWCMAAVVAIFALFILVTVLLHTS
jgi:putative inorganic carbon (HCO3(-)) transporter